MQAMFHRLNPTQLTNTGTLLLAGPVLGTAGFLMHPDEGITAASAVAAIQAAPTQWAIAHALITLGFVATALGVFGLLRAGLRVTEPTWTRRSWRSLGITFLIAAPVPLAEIFVPWMNAGKDAAAYTMLGNYQLPFILLGFVGFLVSALVLGIVEMRNPCPAAHKAFAGLAIVGALAGLVGAVGHIAAIKSLVYGDFGYVLVLLYAAVAGVNALRMARGLRAEGTSATPA